MMPDPLLALVLGIIGLMVAALILWPQSGMLARWKKLRLQSTRIQIEDALKHVYDSEYKSVPSTLQSLSGALGLRGDAAAELIERLEHRKLLARKGTQLFLTPDGRSYALRIIRVHRLWERYLSDETDIHESEWHTRAEEKEHFMSSEEANMLSERLGHPLFDPHGDPIPTPAGKVPPPRGTPLTTLGTNEVGAIVHIEDEPEAVYAQLVAQGLYPGMQVRIVSSSPERIVLEAQGNEIALAPVSAANVTIVPLAPAQQTVEQFRTLATLNPGDRAVVTGISSACRGLQRRRLLDLGVVPGTVIGAELRSASGDPTAYKIRGATIALRLRDAQLIFVKDEET